jgi:hypothetical protein
MPFRALMTSFRLAETSLNTCASSANLSCALTDARAGFGVQVELGWDSREQVSAGSISSGLIKK